MKNQKIITASVAAKVNLELRITGRQGSLHTLDMLCCSVDLFDKVTLRPAKESARIESVKTILDGFDEARFKSAMQIALDKFEQKYGAAECVFEIEKNIPPGAGLAGSSAVIAGMMKTLEKHKNIALDAGFLLTLGSDVPYICGGGTARIRGVGEIVEQLDFCPLYFVAAIAHGGVDTARAYALFDELKEMRNSVSVKGNDMEEVVSAGDDFQNKNHLTEAACILNPRISDAEAALREAGAKDVVMSGSGSAVIAVCQSEGDARDIFENLRYGNKLLLRSICREQAVCIDKT